MGEAGHVLTILRSYPQDQRYLLAILLEIQEKEKYLSVEAMRSTAEYLSVPESRVFAVATFYSTLSLRKKGAKVIRVCNGTACHLKGSASVLQALAQTLGVEPPGTTADGEYSIESVNCVGACALAPVVVIGDRTYGKVDASETGQFITSEKIS